jgi:hypothetical protein
MFLLVRRFLSKLDYSRIFSVHKRSSYRETIIWRWPGEGGGGRSVRFVQYEPKGVRAVRSKPTIFLKLIKMLIPKTTFSIIFKGKIVWYFVRRVVFFCNGVSKTSSTVYGCSIKLSDNALLRIRVGVYSL